MSSTSAASGIATTSSTPLIGSGSNNDNGGGGTSTSLYLFTFLATLLLLLCVSSAIILRSFILRRRFRRHVEAAYYAGVWAGEGGAGGAPGARARVGRRPRFFEAQVGQYDGDEKWGDVQPVSAVALSTRAAPAPAPAPTPAPAARRTGPLARWFPNHADAEAEAPSPPAPVQEAPPPAYEGVQLALLVAMPGAKRGDELPELVLGVRALGVRGAQ